MSVKYILGIDPALRKIGIAIYYVRPAFITTIKTPSKDRGPKRLVYIREHIKEVIEDYEFSLACIEAPSYNSTNRSVSWGKMLGVLEILMYERGIPYLMIPPKQLKKFATGSGNASKEKMIEYAEKQTGLELTDDEADAYFLSKLGWCYTKGTNIRYEAEIIHKLKGNN